MVEQHNKRIAVNAVYLYTNSIISLFVGLYTSRVLMQTLGISDFGLYGAVGSIISMLGFLNVSMSSASSRYLTFESVNGDNIRQVRVFSTIFYIHFLLSLIVVILAETLGLWYVCCKLEIPSGRFNAAFWVYQSSVVIGFINIFDVPFYALVAAHEKFKFSSLWNIFNVILRLFLIILLYFITFDKLIYYAFIMTLSNILVFCGYIFYCKNNFKECSLVKIFDRNLFFDIISFTGYSAFSSSSSIIRTQGNTLLINKFFGVVMNASASIANSVIGYTSEFSQNIISAFRPQIIKKYAKSDIKGMQEDVISCIKYCVAIFALVAIPLCIEIDYILKLWLGKIPLHANVLCQVGMIGSLFGLVNMVISIAIQATSKVRINSIAISGISLLSLFFTFIFLKFGGSIISVFVIYSFTQLVILAITLYNVKSIIPELKLSYIVLIFFKLIGIIMISCTVPVLLSLTISQGLFRLMVTSLSFVVIFIFLFWELMMNSSEREIIENKIRDNKLFK